MGITSNTTHAFRGSAGEIKFLTNMDNGDASTKMFLDRSGNLEIGTITPEAKLGVNGSILAKEVTTHQDAAKAD